MPRAALFYPKRRLVTAGLEPPKGHFRARRDHFLPFEPVIMRSKVAKIAHNGGALKSAMEEGQRLGAPIARNPFCDPKTLLVTAGFKGQNCDPPRGIEEFRVVFNWFASKRNNSPLPWGGQAGGGGGGGGGGRACRADQGRTKLCTG